MTEQKRSTSHEGWDGLGNVVIGCLLSLAGRVGKVSKPSHAGSADGHGTLFCCASALVRLWRCSRPCVRRLASLAFIVLAF